MIGAAKQLCPHLVVMPYDFALIESISEQASPACASALCQLDKLSPGIKLLQLWSLLMC